VGERKKGHEVIEEHIKYVETKVEKMKIEFEIEDMLSKHRYIPAHEKYVCLFFCLAMN